jgi:hypothetical protein
MSTFKFKKQMGKKQEFKKEAPGFFDRWVHGTGGQTEVCLLDIGMLLNSTVQHKGVKKEAPGFFDSWVHGTGGQHEFQAVYAYVCTRLVLCMSWVWNRDEPGFSDQWLHDAQPGQVVDFCWVCTACRCIQPCAVGVGVCYGTPSGLTEHCRGSDRPTHQHFTTSQLCCIQLSR